MFDMECTLCMDLRKKVHKIVLKRTKERGDPWCDSDVRVETEEEMMKLADFLVELFYARQGD